MQYRLEQVRKDQGFSGCCLDYMEDSELFPEYTLELVKLVDIDIGEQLDKPLTIDTWAEYNGCLDAYDISVMTMLMDRYRNKLHVNPIVLGRNNYLVDGRHRYTAANTLGMLTIWAYVPVV